MRHEVEKPISSLGQLTEDDGYSKRSLINFCSRFAAAGLQGEWTCTPFCDGDDVGVAVMLTSSDDDAGAAVWSYVAAA